jgi:hypothetical protein
MALEEGAEPDLIRILASKEITRLQDRMDRTPLFLACRKMYIQEGITAFLLELDTFAARFKDRGGTLPIHEVDADKPVANQLVQVYPEAAELTGRHSRH